MPKLKLELDYDFDFALIGISCHQPNYRLAWLLNSILNIDLERSDDLDLMLNKKGEKGYFSFFHYDDSDNFTTVNLIANRSENGFFVPEMKQLDYFLQLWLPENENLSELHQKIKKNEQILACVNIEPETLKSKHNFLF